MTNAIEEARAQIAAEFVGIVRGMGIDLDHDDGIPEALAALLEHLTEVAKGRYAAGVADGRREAAAWLREHGHDDRYQSDRCSDVGEWYSVPSPDLLADALEATTHAPCPDCEDTGWASESNPGTGGGTGRDEQIACPCPRGCPDPADWEADREAARTFPLGASVQVDAEPGLVGTVGRPPTHYFGGLSDLAKVWITWPDGGASGHDPADVRLVGARGCEGDDQGGEDGRF